MISRYLIKTNFLDCSKKARFNCEEKWDDVQNMEEIVAKIIYGYEILVNIHKRDMKYQLKKMKSKGRKTSSQGKPYVNQLTEDKKGEK